ncbi:MAG: gamma-glutamyltransferase family protein [Gammaproteobacteria bacterium]|nr:gamma-glutamyltransferase family protein [Gammaproteobacteria bacterium]
MSFDTSQPYASARSPVIGRQAVATSQPLAVQAGIRVLRAGGNAVDAALATAITLAVVEPNNNGLGGDAFAQIWDGSNLHGINGSGRAPAAWTPERFAGRPTMPSTGGDAVTVPGAVSLWRALSERFGRLPFAHLFEDAIHYAEDGFHVGPKTAYYWQLLPRRFADFPDFLAHFCPDGRAPAAGERFTPAGLAATLRSVAADGGESYYRGDLAERMAAAAAAHGGALTTADMAAHEPLWVEPLSVAFEDTRLHELPPNGQGLGALIAAGVLARLASDRFPLDSADAVHLQIEASRIGIRHAFSHVADPDHLPQDPAELLTPEHLDTLAGRVLREQADPRPLQAPTSPDTVYLCCADAEGMAVSFIQSNYRGFGSGVLVPGTGIALQNRGEGFSLQPGHPNEVGPAKRPFHTIIPGFATRGGDALLAFGVMGGHMQHQGHLQMLERIVLRGQNPQAASDAPRWHIREDGRVALETGFDPKVAAELARRGHMVEMEGAEHVFGGAQIIQRLDNGAWCAGSDHRKEGHAAAF